MMVVQGLPSLAGGKLTGRYLGTHKLAALARNLGPVMADEETMLDWLSTFARWAGRYPIPVTEDEMIRSVWKIEWQVIASSWWERRVDEVFASGWILQSDGTQSGPPMPVWRRSDVVHFPLVALGPRHHSQ